MKILEFLMTSDENKKLIILIFPFYASKVVIGNNHIALLVSIRYILKRIIF